MTTDEAPILNPNAANDEELRKLPGVGPQLAGRIIEGRPYQALQDLRQVPGLGDSTLKRLEPFLTFEAAEPKPAASEMADLDREGDSDRAEDESAKYPLMVTKPQPEGIGIWALLAMGAASVLCSVTLSLAIVIGINGTLNFGRHSALLATQSELRTLQSQLEAAQTETEALRGRAEALEGMSGRMAQVESQAAALSERIDQTLTTVEEMQTALLDALEETRAQAERVNRFQAFLDGLSRLLGQIITEP